VKEFVPEISAKQMRVLADGNVKSVLAGEADETLSAASLYATVYLVSVQTPAGIRESLNIPLVMLPALVVSGLALLLRN
jgi:hypothetical protein